MHENRETSELPAVKPDIRTAGEGLGRTARMYISEESDSGTVPMNQSNKDERLLAEIEEGRPLIEENTFQPDTRSTQSEASVSQGLAGVRKAARENKEMRFTSLLHHVSVDLLRASFYSLKRKAAPGVDGVTWQEYESGRFAEQSRERRGEGKPETFDFLGLFRDRVLRLWGKTLRRRSQKSRFTWARRVAL